MENSQDQIEQSLQKPRHQKIMLPLLNQTCINDNASQDFPKHRNIGQRLILLGERRLHEIVVLEQILDRQLSHHKESFVEINQCYDTQ